MLRRKTCEDSWRMNLDWNLQYTYVDNMLYTLNMVLLDILSCSNPNFVYNFRHAQNT